MRGEVGKKLARACGIATAAIALAAAAAVLVLALAARPAVGIEEGSRFTVERGDSAQAVAIALERKGFIRSAFAFKLFARVEGLGSSLKAGTYQIGPEMGAKRILDVFVSGEQALSKVTIPEGFTLSQIASLLERLGITTKASFLEAASSAVLLSELGIPATSAEGYLFPDTYFLPTGYSAEGVLRTMVKAFHEHLSTIPEFVFLSSQELYERVILASIVEREYKSPDEAPLMASVFYNRLKIHMALQSCATVVYVITEHLGKAHPEVIYDRDLKIDDPYNSYEHTGLPPGPISNPGITSLKAAFYPAASRFLYFRLVDANAGTHHFSATLEEHLDARNLFIKKVEG